MLGLYGLAPSATDADVLDVLFERYEMLAKTPASRLRVTRVSA